MSVKELRISEINSQIDKAIEDRNDNVSIPLGTIKNFMISCCYRDEDKPFGRAYIAKSGVIAWFTSKNEAFGFKMNGEWFNLIDRLDLNDDTWQPYPQEKWDAMLLDYAEGKYDVYCFDPLSICAIYTDKPKGSIFILDGDVWYKSADISRQIFDSKTGVWAQIIELKEGKDHFIDAIKFNLGIDFANVIGEPRYTKDEWIEKMKQMQP